MDHNTQEYLKETKAPIISQKLSLSRTNEDFGQQQEQNAGDNFSEENSSCLQQFIQSNSYAFRPFHIVHSYGSNDLIEPISELAEQKSSLQENQILDTTEATTQKDLESQALNNPMTYLLWSCNSKGLLSRQFYERLTQSFFGKLIQKISLKNLNDRTKINLMKLINFYSDVLGDREIRSILDVEQQVCDNFDSSLSINTQNIVHQMTSKYNSYLSSKSQKRQKQQFTIKQSALQSQNISSQSHSNFASFLNKSMQKLNVLRVIAQTCTKYKVWPTGQGLIVFVRKIMAIRTFFPQLFIKIIKQFKVILGQFITNKAVTEHQIFAKQILTPKYLSFLKIYIQNKDIRTTIKCMYSTTINKDVEQKINQLPYYQRIMNAIVTQKKRLAYGCKQSQKQIQLLIKSLQMNRVRQDKVKIKRSTKKQKISSLRQTKIVQNCHDWNPIDRPTYFNLQLLYQNLLLDDQGHNLQLNTQQLD